MINELRVHKGEGKDTRGLYSHEKRYFLSPLFLFREEEMFGNFFFSDLLTRTRGIVLDVCTPHFTSSGITQISYFAFCTFLVGICQGRRFADRNV